MTMAGHTHTKSAKRKIAKAMRGKQNSIVHGHTEFGGFKSRTYQAWCSMRKRCLRDDLPAWKNYGGRGISFCKRWREFVNFLADMGECPPGLQLERKDNDKGYSKSNCCWATKKVQARNRRTNRVLTFKGKTMTVVEWGEYLGIKPVTISVRLHRGKTVAEALCPPRG